MICFPRRWQLWLGDFVGILWFDVFRIRRDLVIDNITRAFPTLSYTEKIKIGRRSLCNMGRGLVEFCHFPFFEELDVDHHFDIVGADKLEHALQQGRGVCMMSCHMGNGDFAVAALSLKKMPIHLISKEFKIKWINDLWFDLRGRMGTRFIKPRNSSYQILKALKANEAVIFVQDQFMGPPIGAKTKFFGVETGSALGLSVIARKTRAPVLPIYTYRRDDGHGVIVIDDEIPWEDKGEKDETLVHMTQVFNDKIEEIVRLHPEQWMWVHRRWKTFKH